MVGSDSVVTNETFVDVFGGLLEGKTGNGISLVVSSLLSILLESFTVNP